jgi:hypothetical protein
MLSKEQLYEMYVVKRMTTTEIATIIQKTDSTICNWLRKNGIETRQRREAQLPVEPTKEQLLDLYCSQLKSIDQIATELGSSEISIRRLLVQNAIPIRDRAWKCAESNKGKHLPLWQKQLLSTMAKQRVGPKHPRFGMRTPEETRQKIANSLKGRFRGRLNPQWKENATHRWRVTLHNQCEYKEWRKQVFQRDNYSCKACGKPSNGDIQAHHILPLETNPELIFDVLDGITLCRKCHRSIKSKELRFVELFRELIGAPLPSP